MEYMEYKHTRNFTLLYLKPLQEKGLLQMTIPDKPNSKNQKQYRYKIFTYFKYKQIKLFHLSQAPLSNVYVEELKICV